MTHERERNATYKLAYDRDLYARMNSLDMKLYKYGTKVMDLDCEFFLYIYKEHYQLPIRKINALPQARATK